MLQDPQHSLWHSDRQALFDVDEFSSDGYGSYVPIGDIRSERSYDCFGATNKPSGFGGQIQETDIADYRSKTFDPASSQVAT